MSASADTQPSDLVMLTESEVFGIYRYQLVDGTYERVPITTTTTEHHYVTQNGKVVRETIGSGTTAKVLDFIYDSNGRPFALKYTNGTATPVTYYYVVNLQGDVVKLITESGAEVASYTYNAWGEVLTATGTMAEINPLRYRGYYYDTETGFYYLQSRYYDPLSHRFINADSLASTGTGILGCNMFAYCGNNPCTHYDAQGTAYEVIGAGLQIDVTGLGVAEGGVEVIIYWNTKETDENGGPVIAIYAYGGVTADIMNVSDLEYVKDLLGTNLDSLMSNPKKMIKSIISNLKEFNISASGLLLLGNESFKTSKDYEGPFDSYSINLWHFKAAYATSNTCKAVSIGASLNSGFGVSVSKTWYYQIYSSAE